MNDFDLSFERASIATLRAVFEEELASGFARWRQLPSGDTQGRVSASLKLGSRAHQAYDQMLAHCYRNAGMEAALPPELLAIHGRAELDEWTTMCVEAQMSGVDPFGSLLPPPTSKDKRAKELLQQALRKKAIGFELPAKPLFRTKTGCVVYLEVTQRKNFVDSSMMCCREETSMPLANHCGLHGIFIECKADVLTKSPEAVEIVANEIVRHVEMMRAKLIR